MKRSSTQSGAQNKRHHPDTDDIVAHIKKVSRKEHYAIVESISLKNFMCHSRLTMRFSAGVNFIVGHNGSGKSAILTAIIVALGGKASSTSRGTSLKTLIKTGCSFASVEISLKNVGDDQFRPEVYGDKIVIELRITIDGGTSYKIKNDTGKIVSIKKEDLLGILDHLNLFVDNPLTCLTQEMSKNFLHSKNAGDKYKFFLKSTQLEQIKIDYSYILQQRNIMVNAIKHKEKAMPGTQSQVLDKEQRFKDLATLQELEKKVELLKHEHAWAQVMQLEHAFKPVKHELAREKDRLPKYDDAVKKSEEKEKRAEEKFNELQKKVKSYQLQIKLLEPEKTKAKKEYEARKVQHKAFDTQLSRAKRQKHDAVKDRDEMQSRIDELKNQAQTNVEDERQKKEADLAAFTQQREKLQAQYKSLQHQIDQFSQAIQRSKEQLQITHQEEGDLQRQSKAIRQTISSLSGSKRNKLQLFGAKMPEFVHKIEQAYMQGKFAHKPRGPIGSCITVKNQQLVHPVESAIRSYLHSFIVDNHKDEKFLESMRNSIFPVHEQSRIVIYTRKFREQLYDISSGKVRHPNFSSVFDLLKIQDVIVANCLIDMASIETILVIPNTQDAISVIQNGHPPRNCSKAYTKEGDEVYIDRFYSYKGKNSSHYLKADIDSEINRNKAEMSELNLRIQDLKQHSTTAITEVKKNEVELQRHEKSKINLMNQISKVKVDIRQLELDMKEESEVLDVNDLEDEVQNYTQQIESYSTIIEEEYRNTQESTQNMKSSKQVCEELMKKIKDIAEMADDLIEKINISSQDMEKAKGERAHFIEGRKRQLASIQTLQENYDNKRKEIEEESKKATLICPDKIETRRTPNNLDNEIRQIVKRIQKEEEERGDHETVVREYYEAKEQFMKIKRNIKWSKKFILHINEYLKIRDKAFKEIRRLLGIRCSVDFCTLLNQRGFFGSMTFNHEQQELHISVKPHDNAQETKDMKALSGGERSFSTVCYILALWQAIQSPLRCLDEFDVFMDMANRRVAMDMMTEIALNLQQVQFIFLTPHDISALQKSPKISVWKMADPDRGQTTLPFTPISQ